MNRDRRPVGTWGVLAIVLALGAWTGGLAYAQLTPAPHAAAAVAR